MLRQTPVPSGSISTVNSAVRPARGMAKLAASRALTMRRPKIFAALFVENMDVRRVDQNFERICSRTAAHQSGQYDFIKLHADEEMGAERFDPGNRGSGSGLNL